MLSSSQFYIITSLLISFSALIYFLITKPFKSNLNNKILLKNLLENFDLDLPEELKGIDNTSPDSNKLP